MELPKNITQYGNADDKVKIYIEDYVMSYIKQMNDPSKEKELTMAFYGTQKEEADKTFLFIYGAAKVNYLQKETRHLSQAQKQEIEGIRLKYFMPYTFLGYCVLQGNLPDTIHVMIRDMTREIRGYAQFYEKNENMLAYMLDMREECPKPESINSDKYDEAKKRQEERRSLFALKKQKREAENGQGNTTIPKKSITKRSSNDLQISVAASLAVLCVLVVLVAIGNNGQIPENANTLMEETGIVADSIIHTDVLKTQEGLVKALQSENENAAIPEPVAVEVFSPIAPTQFTENIEDGIEGDLEERHSTISETEEMPLDGYESNIENAVPDTQEELSNDSDAIKNESQSLEETEAASAVIEASVMEYEIKKGDTLNAISLKYYGTKEYVEEICKMNHITNPDRIKIGQKIILPKG